MLTDVLFTTELWLHRTGSIQPGDQLLAIDNFRLDNCTLEDSARVLQDTHDIVKLTIKKDENFAGERSFSADVLCCSEAFIVVRHVRLNPAVWSENS